MVTYGLHSARVEGAKERQAMSLMTYLRLKGQKSGEIKGGITDKGFENSIGVIAVTHSIVRPRDPASGLPTGKRMHQPFIFTKELDMSSPILLNVLTTNENLTSTVFNFYAPKSADGTGPATNVYRVEMVNARIASYDVRQANIRDPDNAKLAVYEEVALVYQKITWTWLQGGITAEDDWETPVR
jgi:type VI secretion system secreted protein Hcp